MNRIALVTGALALALVGCVADDPTGEYGLPGSVKPATTPQPAPGTAQAASSDNPGPGLGVFVDALQSNKCNECEITTEVAPDGGEQLHYRGRLIGNELCVIRTNRYGAIVEDTCSSGGYLLWQ